MVPRLHLSTASLIYVQLTAFGCHGVVGHPVRLLAVAGSSSVGDNAKALSSMACLAQGMQLNQALVPSKTVQVISPLQIPLCLMHAHFIEFPVLS